MIDQLLIAVLGLSALWCVNSPNARARKIAPILGLCGQPFWVHSTWESGQVGMLCLALAYTVAWSRGIYHLWIRGEPRQ